MTKIEFEERLGRTVSDAEYADVEYVYTWHPAVSNVDGKSQIATLYQLGVIPDMIDRARRAEQINGEIAHVRREIADLRERLDNLICERNSI